MREARFVSSDLWPAIPVRQEAEKGGPKEEKKKELKKREKGNSYDVKPFFDTSYHGACSLHFQYSFSRLFTKTRCRFVNTKTHQHHLEMHFRTKKQMTQFAFDCKRANLGLVRAHTELS